MKFSSFLLPSVSITLCQGLLAPLFFDRPRQYMPLKSHIPQFDVNEILAFEKQLNENEAYVENSNALPPDSLQEDELGFADIVRFDIGILHHLQRLDVALAAALPQVSRSVAGTFVENGFVHLVNKNGRLEGLKRKSFKVENGMTLQLKLPKEDASTLLLAQKIPLNILYEDEHIIVLNKAANVVVHPAAGNWNGTIVNALAYYLNNESKFGPGEFMHRVGKDILERQEGDIGDEEIVSVRPGIVHRLDKGTTGVLLVAKSRIALAALSQSFKSRNVTKVYLAVTVGNPGKSVTIDKPIGRHPVHRQRMRVVPDPHRKNKGGYAPKDRVINDDAAPQAGRRALSYVDSLAFDGKLSVVQIRIETGRTHQIRVHLQDRHTPIYGDDIYGLSDWNQKLYRVYQISRPLLHAYSLEIDHPITKERMKFRAPIADDMKRVMKAVWPGIDSEASGILVE
jgi:23S rRNA pseudouridine1911/1915/1917 synthase